MSFSALPIVLVRLVMQGGDLRSLLALARCSQHCRSAASHDAAFHSLSPVSFRSTRPNLAASITGSLLRFATIGLRWTHAESGPMQPQPDRDEMLAIVAIPRLRVLDARGRQCPLFDFLPAMLQHPSAPLQQLTALYTSRNGVDVDCMTLLATHCRSLRTLHCHAVAFAETVPLMQQLAKLPGLTDLEFAGYVSEAAMFEPLCSYTGLVTLSLLQLSQTAWQLLLMAPCTESVECLRLDQLAVAQSNEPNASAASFDWATCFKNLAAMRSLELEQCGSIDLLLPALIDHAPKLRSLTVSLGQEGLVDPVDLSPFAFPRHYGSTKPSVELLERLLSRRPACEITIHLVPQALYVFWRGPTVATEEQLAVARGEWDRAHGAYSGLAARFPGRVRVIPPPEPEIADAEPLKVSAPPNPRWWE